MAPKKKQEKMALGDFLTNQSLGSWADEMDSQPLPTGPSGSSYGNRDRDRDGGERRAFTQPSWETARSGSGMGGGGGMGMGMGMGGRGASYDRPRFAEREQLPLPSKPPYTAHLGNLTYDVTQSDIEGFFASQGSEVTSVRIVEDKVDQKPKGFGYVEFATLDALKTALTMTETPFMGRNVKISIAEPPKASAESTRDFSDWSRRGPLPDLPQNQRQPSNRGFGRNFDNMSDAGSERGGSGSRRPAFFEAEGKVRDFSSWERKGPLSPVPNQEPQMRDGGRVREGGPRQASPAWGEARSNEGSRPPRKEFEPRPPVERAPTAAEQDTAWRTGMKPDASPAPTPDVSTPSSPQLLQPPAPKERPKLNLTKRTVSTADPDAASGSATDSKASPFGAARPIDTAARERAVEERRELALRQKKEADEKAREEKTAKEAASRAARADRADRGQAQEDEQVTSPVSENGTKPRRASRQQNGTKQPVKENGETPIQTRPSFSILSRDAEGGDDGEEANVDEKEANGDANDSIAVVQPAVANDVPKDAVEGLPQVAEPFTQEMEADGWSTVAAKPRNNRRGGPRVAAT